MESLFLVGSLIYVKTTLNALKTISNSFFSILLQDLEDDDNQNLGGRIYQCHLL